MRDPRIFLRAAASLPFDWGGCDCALFAADWIKLAMGVDPAADLRGNYSTRTGAYLLMREEGGLLAIIVPRMAAHGFIETLRPVPGDVGIIKHREAVACAIKVQSGWACKAPRGIFVAPFEFIKAWSV